MSDSFFWTQIYPGIVQALSRIEQKQDIILAAMGIGEKELKEIQEKALEAAEAGEKEEDEEKKKPEPPKDRVGMSKQEPPEVGA